MSGPQAVLDLLDMHERMIDMHERMIDTHQRLIRFTRAMATERLDEHQNQRQQQQQQQQQQQPSLQAYEDNQSRVRAGL
jgi:hypothetical protein